MNIVVRIAALLGLVESTRQLFPRPDGGVAVLDRDTLQVWPASVDHCLCYRVGVKAVPAPEGDVRWPVLLERDGGEPIVLTYESSRRAAQRALSVIAGAPRKRIGWGGALAGVFVVIFLALLLVRTPLAVPAGAQASVPPQPTSLQPLSPLAMPEVRIAASPAGGDVPELSVSMEDLLACDVE